MAPLRGSRQAAEQSLKRDNQRNFRGSNHRSDAQGPSFRGGINAIGEQFTGTPVPLPRLLQGNVRIDPERNRLLLAGKPVVVSPLPATSRGNEEVQTAAVGDLPWPAQRLRLRNRLFRKRSGS